MRATVIAVVYRSLEMVRRLVAGVYGYLSFVFSFTRTRSSYIIEQWTGAVDLAAASRVAVFTHFDRRGVVHDFVRYYLTQLQGAGYTVVFVSNAPTLQPPDLEWLKSRCGVIIRRTNVGRDFSAYKDGISAIPDLQRLESLLLVNDSVYGPFEDLTQVIARMELNEADVWSITDNWQRRYHLQSYFLLFGRKAIASEGFRRFWKRVRPVQSKHWVITRYEVGLTRDLVAAGLRCRALFPFRSAAAGFTEILKHGAWSTLPSTSRQARFRATVIEAVEMGVPLNASHFFWEYLIVGMSCPFLKRDLLLSNPARVPGLVHWEEVVRSVSHYDTDLILRHLEVAMRDRVV